MSVVFQAMSRISLKKCLALCTVAFAVPATLVAGNGVTSVADALNRASVKVPFPQKSILFGGAQAGQKIVVVGERGLILTSDDAGSNWQQSIAPVSNTLTAVRFADEAHGVAVGHAGVVLMTSDGGEHWSLALDGSKAAKIFVKANPKNPDAQRLLDDGPDKPFLDVLFWDSKHVVAVGAYGLVFGSNDGGVTWESWMGRFDNPSGLHFYAIRQRGSEIVVAGEQGSLFRSDDAGVTFKRLLTPYKGSFFTLELPGEREIVVAGLRGNVWKSQDGGHVWEPAHNDVNASITSSQLLDDGSLLFGDQAGRLLRLEGNALVPATSTPLPPINGVILSRDGKQKIALTLQGVLSLK